MKRICAALAVLVFFSSGLHSPLTGQNLDKPLIKLLEQRKYREALEQMDGQSETSNPRYLYWRAVCEATTGQPDLAIQTCQDICRRWPGSVHCVNARELGIALNNHESTSRRIVSQFQTAIEDFRATDSLIQFDVRLHKSSPPRLVRVGVDFKNRQCRFSVSANDEILCAIDVNEGGSRYFIADQQQICAVDEVLFPVLDFGIERLDNQALSFSLSAAISSDPTVSEATFDKLLGSRWFSTTDGLRELLIDRGMQTGCIPLSVTSDGGQTVCKWKQLRFPETGNHEIHVVFVDGRLQRISSEDVELCMLESQADDSSRLQPLTWPNLAVVQQEMNAAELIKFGAALKDSLSPPGGKEQVADERGDKTIR